MYRLRKLTRDATLIATVIGSLLILFSLQAFLSEKAITGDVIQVGRPGQVDIGNQPPQPPPPPRLQELDPKTKCWLARGLREEDFILLGPLLQQSACTTPAPRQSVQATVNQNCLAVTVGSEAGTRVCLEQQQPSFSVELSTPTTAPVIIPETKPSYWLAFFIFFVSLGTLLAWGKTDLQYDHYRRRASQDFTRLLPGQDEVQIRYIKPPPSYIKKIPEAVLKTTTVYVQPLPYPAPAKAAEQQKLEPSEALQVPEEQRVLASPLNKSLVAFNALSQYLSDLIATKKFTEAEQEYPQLYRLALDIYPKVTDDNKPRLLQVVTALHEQLQDVRKAYAVAQDVREVYQKEAQQEQPVQVWKPASITMKKEQIHNLDRELTKLRQQLENTPSTNKPKRSKSGFFP